MELDIQDFRRARTGTEGYDRDEVDRFVAEVLEALRHTPPRMAPWEVRDKVFTTQRVHRGYHEHDVDDFLDQAERALREAHGAGLADPHEAVQPQSADRGRHALGQALVIVAVVVVVVAAAAIMAG